MELQSQKQLNPVQDEVSAITAVVRPILRGLLYALKQEVASDHGGRETILLRQMARNHRPGDGDCGICFEYAVHDSITRNEASVVERVEDALKLCKVKGQSIDSILFGAEKEGAQQLIQTAESMLTSDSVLMSGTRGHPVKLKGHIRNIATSFRSDKAKLNLPQSISGIWKADLFLGSSEPDKWVATTVKINRNKLVGARGLRVGIIPAAQGGSDAVRLDDKKNLVLCPVPYDGQFMETFYSGWSVVQSFIRADAQVPTEVNLPRPPERQVARYLSDRRDFKVVDVIDALEALSQPHLLDTTDERAALIGYGGHESEGQTRLLIAPEPVGMQDAG